MLSRPVLQNPPNDEVASRAYARPAALRPSLTAAARPRQSSCRSSRQEEIVARVLAARAGIANRLQRVLRRRRIGKTLVGARSGVSFLRVAPRTSALAGTAARARQSSVRSSCHKEWSPVSLRRLALRTVFGGDELTRPSLAPSGDSFLRRGAGDVGTGRSGGVSAPVICPLVHGRRNRSRCRRAESWQCEPSFAPSSSAMNWQRPPGRPGGRQLSPARPPGRRCRRGRRSRLASIWAYRPAEAAAGASLRPKGTLAIAGLSTVFRIRTMRALGATSDAGARTSRSCMGDLRRTLAGAAVPA